MNLDLRHLTHILAVARTRSFTRAAEELCLTQPALSRSIAAFEDGFGVVLFDRGRGGVTPTAVGNLVVQQAEALVRSARGFDLNLRLYASGDAGQLCIGMGPMMASILLAPLSRDLVRLFPKLNIMNLIRTPDRLLSALREDEIELVVGHPPASADTADLDVSILARLDIGIYVRRGHPLAAKDGPSVSALLRFPIACPIDINFHSGESVQSIVCDNYHVLRDLVLQSDCVFFSAEAFVAEAVADGSLVRMRPSDLAPLSCDIALAVRTGRTLSPAALAAIRQVKATLAPFSPGA